MLSLIRLSFLSFFLGIITCTWDKILALDIFNFTLKIHQLFFVTSFLLVLAARRNEGIPALLQKNLTKFFLTILALGGFYAAASPWSFFPLKSFLYAGWLIFNLTTIWLTAQLLAPFLKKIKFVWAAWAAMLIQSLVIITDHIAYQFGFTGGLIGFNQDVILKWGASRPHGFSSEPSYVAVFLCFSLILSFGALSSLKNAMKWMLLSTMGLAVFAIVATTSRTGWLALAACSSFYLFFESFSQRKFPWKKISVLILVVVGSFTIFYFSTPPAQRSTLDNALLSSIRSGTDGSGNSRVKAHLHAWEMAKETKFLGTGLGASYKYYFVNKIPPNPKDDNVFDGEEYGNEVVMSTWGQLLAEGGLPAIFLYLFAVIFFLKTQWAGWKKNQDGLALAAFVSSLVFFCFVAFWLGNVARGDIWVWFAIWSRMAMPDLEQDNSHRV